ncbi:MAG: GGDEF domain-containing protein, partial [Solirubrobacteraceae bacterium]|nr:GGDEF domain-containing protein [Solirubrobacteraceae bacterium]
MAPSVPSAARRLLRPIPELDGRTRRAWSATQPADRPATHQIGLQFLVAAAAAGFAAQFAAPYVSTPGYLFGIAAAALGIGIYLRFSLHAGELSIDRSITAAILLVAGTVMVARPTGLTPMLYLWPLLLSAHYALPGRLATNGALALITFCLSVATVADTRTPVASLLIFVVVSVGATVAYRRVRTKVAELFGELEELSSHDPLTGALTAEAFERAFGAWVGNGLNRRLESSLLLVDVDHFAAVNEAHGHEAGDAALRHLSTIVYDCIRETDAFGRIDGEEFGLLFPATSGPEAMVAAERIRAAVAERSAQCG